MKEKLYSSLTKNERTGMKGLGEQEDIVITKANKGGVAVIVDVKQVEKQLNTKNYRKFQKTKINK